MTQSTDEQTDELHNESTTEWLGVGRRPLLKALGAGTTLSLGAGLGAAAGDRFDDQEGGEATAEQLHPVFGYATTDAGSIPEEMSPDHEVQMLAAPPAGKSQPPFLVFDPVGLHVESGDIVQFTAMTPDHTVTAYHPGIGFDHGRVPEDSQPFSSPVLGPGAAWLYRFETEGVYDMYCGPHHLMGMVMRTVVGDLSEDALPDYATSVEGLPTEKALVKGFSRPDGNELSVWPFLTAAEVLGADPLHPMNIQEAGTVSFSAVADALDYEFKRPGAETQTTEGNGTTTTNAAMGRYSDE